MYVGMGLRKNRYGVYIVRHKVPKHLEEPVARLLNNSKDRQAYLQKTTGTKDRTEAKRIAVDILAGFNNTLAEAQALLAERPLRTALSPPEIERIAEFHYASVLAADEEFTSEYAQADEDFVRSVAAQLDKAGVEYDMPAPFETQRPTYGLTNRQVVKRNANSEWWLQNIRAASARGDISIVGEVVSELLDRFRLNLDPNSAAYRKLGMAVLRADVRANEALALRYRGEPVETPAIAHLEPSADVTERTPVGNNTLSAAFAGWKKQRERSAGTVREYERACELFVQLHGHLPVTKITRSHARTFREALQDMPRSKPGELAKAVLPELVEWRRTHPHAPKITSKTVNKLFGGVQAIVNWAHQNDMIPDQLWADPFSKMRVEEDDPEGGPFEPDELRTLFASPVFTVGERPKGAGKGDVVPAPCSGGGVGNIRSDWMRE